MPRAKSAKVTKNQVEIKAAPEEVKTTENSKSVHGKVVYPKLDILEYSTTVNEGDPVDPWPGRGPMNPDDWKELMGWETESQYQARKVKEANTVKEVMLKVKERDWVKTVAEKLDATEDVALKVIGEVGLMVAQKKEIKPENYQYGDEYHCFSRRLKPGGKPKEREKVRCRHNANNRPFDEGWGEEVMHMVLVGQWAGPHTIPGETVNGETVRVGRYGHVLSGQHQGTACIWADEELALSREAVDYDPEFPKYPFWDGHDHPFIETIVVLGVSEDERVLRTIDYVKPRTIADMLFTMPLYKNNSPVERRELTRMLSSAIDLLWHRTDAQGYKTHPEVVGFLERHNRLLTCVEHLFCENNATGTNEFECKKCKVRSETKASDHPCLPNEDHDFFARNNRRISALNLSPGQCAAICFLQGCSATPLGDESTDETSSDDYRNMCPPKEDVLNWSLWDRARSFWTGLAGDRALIPVRTALNRLTISKPGNEDNQGLGGRIDEKLAVLSLAWGVYKDHPLGDPDNPPFNADDVKDGGSLDLHYTNLDENSEELPDGQVTLVNVADFLGIDMNKGIKKSRGGVKDAPLPPAPTKEVIEKREMEVINERAAKEDAKKGAQRKPRPAPGKLDELAARAARDLGNTKRPPIVRKP